VRILGCPATSTNDVSEFSLALRWRRLVKYSTPCNVRSALPSTYNCVSAVNEVNPSSETSALDSRCKHRRLLYDSRFLMRVMPRWCRYRTSLSSGVEYLCTRNVESKSSSQTSLKPPFTQRRHTRDKNAPVLVYARARERARCHLKSHDELA